ncbi:unnamed protein product [Danaus chrysippus]|uniref:(African queen) hypothetical protein n=1 Tax=Danaus chrysippus TaxID=151541 RepID=A0A8J2WAE9_9NEOP|nr:unnamed protein product [Danaus chrysippus]
MSSTSLFVQIFVQVYQPSTSFIPTLTGLFPLPHTSFVPTLTGLFPLPHTSFVPTLTGLFALPQHSCMPNVFVQNVFVDTHDPRFPWVSFFALRAVRAGAELTWNYNYDVGSVPGKVLYCYCGAPTCRGRLL